MIAKLSLLFASASGLVAVALGAFGAHGLKGRLDEAALSAYQTAVQYQFYHALALLAVGLLTQRLGERPLLSASAFCFMLGMVLFSGSLYVLALGGPRWLGPITPLGGLAFMVAWLLLFIAVLRTPMAMD